MKIYAYQIPSREEILGVFRQTQQALSLADLGLALNVKPEELDGMSKRLSAMERDGQVRQDRRGQFKLTSQDHLISGRVSSHREGYGFLTPDDGSADLFLPEREMQKVLHGDRVMARVAGADKKGRLEGSIVEVTERANTHVVGRLLQENGVWLVVPEDKRFQHDILLAETPAKNLAGQIVSVELLEQPSRYAQPVGKIAEVLGGIDDPGMEIEIAVRKFGVPHVFSDAALDAAAKLPGTVQKKDLKDRVDLRDIPLVTIDGEDARDFDDAVYCEPVKLGRNKAYRLLVAIADVSHYVKPGQPLDRDALLRSTSVYFPRRVIPMLPEKLSNGLCSLNPDVERLTLVCDMVITKDGEMHGYQFYPAVIHSAARLTYTEVAAILGNTKGPEAAKRSAIVPHLQHLYEVFQVLLKSRQARGAIDFDTTETYIVCNSGGKIEKIIPRVRNDAHRLIEECMLAANVCAADLLQTYKHLGVYRVHSGPTKEKLTTLRNYLRQVGLSLPGGDSPQASDYAELRNKIKGRPDEQLLQTMLLRSMQQAMYSPDNLGHFGLAYEAYTHFTSPIRRYPDLLTHRAIKAIIAGETYRPTGIDLSLLNTTVPVGKNSRNAKAPVKPEKKPKKGPPDDLEMWELLGLHCSSNERRADEASRDVENWLKCYYMRNRLGEEFQGTITGVTQFGIFVQLDEIFVEGMVHITELGADYFQFDEARHELRGERTGKRYQLMDKVQIQISRVDLDSRRIDLALAGASAAAVGRRGERRPEKKRADENEGWFVPNKQKAQTPKKAAVAAPAEKSRPAKGKAPASPVSKKKAVARSSSAKSGRKRR
ncbi:ribonuclease R [Undibacterium luofuense]|uniref:Ribonuclease R n=2 Tax=Undibacterium luofuense TaxID=2828733 RepID=A0A941DNX9_9BURK|nr:ribonuclease R [Undibacterium luofuense]MBR7783007.1 ribonuclease R [Undibacterium luofuense]